MLLDKAIEMLSEETASPQTLKSKKYVVQTRKTALAAWKDETPLLSLTDAKKVAKDFDDSGIKNRIVVVSQGQEDKVWSESTAAECGFAALNNLLQLVEVKDQMKNKPVINNYVAKHAQTSGAGAHEDKQGKRAKRTRQKRQWKKEEGLL